MTPERIAELRAKVNEDGYLGDLDAAECLDAIEELQIKNNMHGEFWDAVVKSLRECGVSQASPYAHRCIDLLAEERDRYLAALERIALDGRRGGMGGGLMLNAGDYRDIAREALEVK